MNIANSQPKGNYFLRKYVCFKCDIQCISIKKKYYQTAIFSVSIFVNFHSFIHSFSMKEIHFVSPVKLQIYYGQNRNDATVWNLVMFHRIKWQNASQDQYLLL